MIAASIPVIPVMITVADQHVGVEGVERLDRLFTAKYCSSLKPGLVQDNRKRIRNHLLVVGNQDARLGVICCCFCHKVHQPRENAALN